MNLLVVSPHGRSGSNFIQSLFDGHPQVITFPTHKLRYPDWEVGVSASDCVAGFISNNAHLFEEGAASIDGFELSLKRKAYKSGELDSKINVNDFVEVCKSEFGLRWSTPIVRKDFVVGLHKSYARLRGFDVPELKYILFHLHGYRNESHERALSDFPDMKFIAMTRDPRETWLSWDREWAWRNSEAQINYKTVRPLFFIRVMLRYKKAIYGLASFSPRLPSGNVVIIDLNKFHELNRMAMSRLAKWLKIEFRETLMESTLGGITWLGNAADKKPISGFNIEKSEYKWPINLSDDDCELISSLLANEITLLGYPSVTSRQKSAVSLGFPHWAYLYLRCCELNLSIKDVYTQSVSGLGRILRGLRLGQAFAIGVIELVRDYVALVREVRRLNNIKATLVVPRISGWRLD